MDAAVLTQSPFTVLTGIVAPALLTNASTVFALSTTNRMLRTRESMSELLAQSDAQPVDEKEKERLIAHVNRVEEQAGLLLGALHTIYSALAAFAAATLVTLVGAALGPLQLVRVLALLGLVLGAAGVACLITGCVLLFHATQLSLINIREEATIIRERYQGPRTKD